MFKNRSLQVKMVKDGEETSDIVEEVGQFEIKAEVVAQQVKSILLYIGGGIVAYIVADTIRQVTIEEARRRQL